MYKKESTWVLYGCAHIGKPVYIPHWAHKSLLSGPHIGLLWVCPYGLVCMGPIWTYQYGQARIHPTLGPFGLGVQPHMGPLWACPYKLGSWALYGLDYMGKPVYTTHWSHMGPIWACLHMLQIQWISKNDVVVKIINYSLSPIEGFLRQLSSKSAVEDLQR